MDGEESSSENCLIKLLDPNKLENILFLFYLECLIIFLILFCTTFEFSYLTFYSKIFIFLSFAIIIICLLFSILYICWKRNNTIKTRENLVI